MTYSNNRNEYDCNYNGFHFERTQERNQCDYRDQNNEWEEGINYGWNYYPQTEEKFDSFDTQYKKAGFSNYSNENQFDKDNNDCKSMNNCWNNRPCFRPCFPLFPCFNRHCNRNCEKRHDCREDWRCPYHCPCNEGNKRPERPNHYDRDNKKTCLYFSGSIEIKNCDRKFN